LQEDEKPNLDFSYCFTDNLKIQKSNEAQLPETLKKEIGDGQGEVRMSKIITKEALKEEKVCT
jgi:hypothetical protein